MELRRGTDKARGLRHSATDAECALWTHLRSRRFGGSKFRRQHAVSGFVVDFVCLERRLVIELDGSQHFEQADYDLARTAVLAKSGFRVLRFWNNEVLEDIEGVLTAIHQQIAAPPSPQPLSRQRERG